MSNSIYTGLTRQSGLLLEMQSIANNIANSQTTGFKSQKLGFTEFIKRTGYENSSLSMASARLGMTDFMPGSFQETGNAFDMAIESEGFFLVQDQENGSLGLTRAGHFQLQPDGTLLSAEGHLLLDSGQVPILLPPDIADFTVTTDGTIHSPQGVLAQVGLFLPNDITLLERHAGTTFLTDDISPDPNPSLKSGFLEASNVNAIEQMTRMIEVQRAYELGQSFSNAEDERIRSVIALMKA